MQWQRCTGVPDTFANFKLWLNGLVESYMSWPSLFLLQLLSSFRALPLTWSIIHFHAHLQTGFPRARSNANASFAELQSLSCVDFFFFFLPYFSFFFFLNTLHHEKPTESQCSFSMNRPGLKRNRKHCIGWWDAVQCGASKLFHLDADSLPVPLVFVLGGFCHLCWALRPTNPGLSFISSCFKQEVWCNNWLFPQSPSSAQGGGGNLQKSLP